MKATKPISQKPNISASFSFSALKAVFCFVMSIFLVKNSHSSSTELIKNGDFSSLHVWQDHPSEYILELADRNSSFTTAYPDNGKSVKFSGGEARSTGFALFQNFDLKDAKRFKFSVDFLLLDESANSEESGWVVHIFEEPDFATRFLGFNFGTRFMANLSKDGEHRIFIPPHKFHRNIWYQFFSEIDLEARSWSGYLRSEDGQDITFDSLPLPKNSPTLPSAFLVRKLGVHPGLSVLFDNISVKISDD